MEDKTKRGVVKAVLVFSALVIGVISLYTTFTIFSASGEHLALSPGDYVKQINESNETNKTYGGEERSFVIDGGDKFDEFTGEEEGNEFSTDILPEKEVGRDFNNLINPLVVYEEVRVGNGNRGHLFLFIAILEIIVIYFVYRRFEGNFIKSKNSA